jgi:hypothetical protein
MTIQFAFIFSILLIATSFVNGQQKDCNTVNIPGETCVVQILSKKHDTIIGFVENSCFSLAYDQAINTTWIIYFEDTSTIREIINFKDGKQTKSNFQYFENGAMYCHSAYEKGELIGPYIRYYENGLINYAGIYSKDSFVGTIYKYWDNGKIAEVKIKTDIAYNAKYITHYDAFGNLISEEEFKQLWYCDP